jgi:hypothetical protein
VRLQLMLVGCIGKNMCWKITLTLTLKWNIGSKQRKNRSWRLVLLTYWSENSHKKRKGEKTIGKNLSPKERKQHKKILKEEGFNMTPQSIDHKWRKWGDSKGLVNISTTFSSIGKYSKMRTQS